MSYWGKLTLRAQLEKEVKKIELMGEVLTPTHDYKRINIWEY